MHYMERKGNKQMISKLYSSDDMTSFVIFYILINFINNL